MIEMLDMGKYDFFVWSSIGIFLAALLIDFLSASGKQKQLKKQIKAQNRKKTRMSKPS